MRGRNAMVKATEKREEEMLYPRRRWRCEVSLARHQEGDSFLGFWRLASHGVLRGMKRRTSWLAVFVDGLRATESYETRSLTRRGVLRDMKAREPWSLTRRGVSCET